MVRLRPAQSASGRGQKTVLSRLSSASHKRVGSKGALSAHFLNSTRARYRHPLLAKCAATCLEFAQKGMDRKNLRKVADDSDNAVKCLTDALKIRVRNLGSHSLNWPIRMLEFLM